MNPSPRKTRKPRVRKPKCIFSAGWGLQENQFGHVWYQIPGFRQSWVLDARLCRNLAKELIKCADYLEQNQKGPR